MNEMILTDQDLMQPEHFPVTVSFGLYEDARPGLVSVVLDAAKGIGYDYNDKGIRFWDQLDEYDKAHEEQFDVECYLLEDSCKLTYAEFYHYMSTACRRFELRFPEVIDELEEALGAYRESFL